jgi:hypothetical protein
MGRTLLQREKVDVIGLGRHAGEDAVLQLEGDEQALLRCGGKVWLSSVGARRCLGRGGCKRGPALWAVAALRAGEEALGA